MKKRILSGLIFVAIVGCCSLPCFADSCCGGFGAKATATPTPAVKVNKWVKYYHDKVAEFREENAKLDKDKKYVLFVGDSLTERFPLERYFPGKAVLNRGIIADGIGILSDRGVLNRMDESVFDCSPSVIFLLIGVNDLPHPKGTPENCLEGLRKIVDQIQEKLPNTPLILHTALPTGEKYSKHDFLNPRILKYNEGIKKLAEEKKLPLIDLYPLYRDENGLLKSEMTRDGLHIGVDNYDLWTEKAKPYLP